MPDREKVIKGLETALAVSNVVVGTDYVVVKIGEVKKVLELLKEQEPVKPIDDGDDSYVCDNCGETVGWEELDVFGIDPVKYKFCPGCGRRVKWDAAD